MKKQPSTHNLRIHPSSPPESHDSSPSESPRTSLSSLSLGLLLSGNSRPSSSRTPPPSDLLDDDPFASHSPSTSNEFFPVPLSVVESSFHKPQSEATRPGRPPLRPSPSVPMLRTNSPGFPGGRQLRPAYTRPAFSTRPSLPSLNLLAKSEFAVTVKARKGTVGARLPLEPWDNIDPEPSMNTVPDAPHIEMELPSAGSDRSMGNDSTQPSEYSRKPSSPIHVLLPSQDDGSRTSSVFVQSPTSLEVDPSQPDPHHDSGEMFSSLYDVITRLSPTHSRSSSASSFGYISRQSQALPRFGNDLTPRSSLESECSDEEIQTCSPSSPRDGARVLSPEPGPTPYTSEYPMPGGYLGIEEFQPGTSVGTIRPIIHRKTSREGSLSSDEGEEEDWHSVYDDAYFNGYEDAEETEAVDADGWERGRSSAGGGYRDNHRSARSQSRGRDLNGSSGGGGGDGARGYSGGGSGNGGRDDEDDRRRDDRNGRRVKASYPANDTEESGTDDEQPPVPPLPHHIADAKRRPARAAAHPQVDLANTDDDDVPLARSIPTALKAQRTIRRQVRDENDERRRQRSIRYKGRQLSAEPDLLMPVPTHASPPRPARDASRSPLPTTRTNIGAQELVAPAPIPRTRPRAKTFTTGNPNPFSADDLAKRLMSSQVNGAPSASSSRHPSVEASTRRPSADDYGPRPAPATDELAPQARTLRPMRSFHRGQVPEASGSLPVPPAAPTTPSSYRVGRSNTSAAPSSKRHEDAYAGKPASLPARSFAEQAPPQRSRSVRRRPSDDLSRGTSRQPSAVPDVPPVPPPAPAPAHTGAFQVVSREKAAQASWQQRVFIFDMQRFHMVEIGPGTTARDVVNVLEQQGHLANWAGAGGWMVFEISQDFGMERPVRGFEIVADVVKSWDKDRTVNTLLAKKTPLASVLHHSVIPASSPRCGGYVEWEVKRGSWKKRWLELREQGLWLAKKDTGKDETFLCSVSNFDGYVVTRIHRSPKPFAFAVKSTDNLTFFENANDYVHVFSCGEKDGHNWLEKIMLARSYIINQERNVISSVGQTASAAGANVSRAGTRKGARLAPPQPLLSSANAAPAPVPDRNNVFEPGSLLSKR